MSSSNAALSSSIRINPRLKTSLYTPKYCTLKEFQEDYLKYSVNTSTVPTLDGALRCLETAEAIVDSHEWGTYRQDDEILSGNWELLSIQYNYAGMYTQSFIPNHNSIQRVVRLDVNMGGTPSGEPLWTQLYEGPGPGTHFVINKSTRLKEQVGSSIFVYSNLPYPGPWRIRITYEYGMNIDRALLRQWVGKTAACDALEQRSAQGGININLDKGPWGALFKQYKADLKELEEKLFPQKKRRVYIYPAN
jgi:hypothetical protein